MYQNFAMIFFALGYLGSSDAIHSASELYIGSPASLVNNDVSLENIMASVQQLEPDFFSKTYALADRSFAKTQQYTDNNITKIVNDGYTLIKFLQQLYDSATSADLSKQAILGAVRERLSKYSPPKPNPQLVEVAVANIKEVGEEALEDCKEYLKSVLDSFAKYPSNLVHKILVKIDLLLSFYERTNGTGSFTSSSQISDEDKQLAADMPEIMNALAADFGIVSTLAELVRNTGALIN